MSKVLLSSFDRLRATLTSSLSVGQARSGDETPIRGRRVFVMIGKVFSRRAVRRVVDRVGSVGFFPAKKKGASKESRLGVGGREKRELHASICKRPKWLSKERVGGRKSCRPRDPL